MKYILYIIFLLGYIFFAISIFTSKDSVSSDFAMFGLLTSLYCPFAIAICKLYNIGDNIGEGE
jgi:hypothetical protein